MASLFTSQMLQSFFLLWACLLIIQAFGDFIDSSKRSLKCVLLHNRNKHESIPLGHSVVLKESYWNIEVVLERLKYCDHQRLIWIDLKMVIFLLGQQGGQTKYFCFLCYWDRGACEMHWVRMQSPSRNTMKAEKEIS